MNIYNIGALITWIVLITQSILALALVFSGVSYRLQQRRLQLETTRRQSTFLDQLKVIKQLNSTSDIHQRLESLKKETRFASDGPCYILGALLTRNLDQAAIETAIQIHIEAIEGGAIRLCIFLARTGPLVGLAGTFVGVQSALAIFGKEANDPRLVGSSFSTAVLTSLVGVWIAFACLSVSRLLWEPSLKKTMVELFEFGVAAQSYIRDIKERFSDETISGRQSHDNSRNSSQCDSKSLSAASGGRSVGTIVPRTL